MKLTLRSAAIIAAGILAVFLFGWFYGHNSSSTPAIIYVDSTKYSRNSKGQEIATRLMMEATQKEFKRSMDSVARIFDLKARNLIQYIASIEHGRSNLAPTDTAHWNFDAPFTYFPDSSDTTTIVFNNTTRGYLFVPQKKWFVEQPFGNAYYKAKVRIGDSAYMTLESFDTVKQVLSRVKIGGNWFTQVSTVHANPDIHTTYTGSSRIQDVAYSRWSIGGHLGYGYNVIDLLRNPNMQFLKTQGHFMISAGINYDLIRFKKRR